MSSFGLEHAPREIRPERGPSGPSTPEDRGVLAATKPHGQGGEVVYSLVSDVDLTNKSVKLGDQESPSEMASKLRQEAESFLSSMVTTIPNGALEIKLEIKLISLRDQTGSSGSTGSTLSLSLPSRL